DLFDDTASGASDGRPAFGPHRQAASASRGRTKSRLLFQEPQAGLCSFVEIRMWPARVGVHHRETEAGSHYLTAAGPDASPLLVFAGRRASAVIFQSPCSKISEFMPDTEMDAVSLATRFARAAFVNVPVPASALNVHVTMAVFAVDSVVIV